jgi:hypothetical protein
MTKKEMLELCEDEDKLEKYVMKEVIKKYKVAYKKWCYAMDAFILCGGEEPQLRDYLK